MKKSSINWNLLKDIFLAAFCCVLTILSMFIIAWGAARGSGSYTPSCIGSPCSYLYLPVTREEPGWLTDASTNSINVNTILISSAISRNELRGINTNYILLQNSLQSGATLYIASASIDGQTILARTSGNVGISTIPLTNLHVNGGASGASIRLSGAATFTHGLYFFDGLTQIGGLFENSATAINLVSSGSIPMVIGTNNTERLRVDSGGNISIGNATVPISKLEIHNTASGNTNMLQINQPSFRTYGWKFYANDSLGVLNIIPFNNSADATSAALSITGNPGNVGIGIATNTNASSLLEVVGGSVTIRGANNGLIIGTNTIITNAGNIGIGSTANPAAFIDLSGRTSGEQSYIRFREPAFPTYGFIVRDNDADGFLKFIGINAGSERALPVFGMDRSVGNVGISTGAPGAKLDVNGGIRQTTATSCANGVTTDANGLFSGCVASDFTLKRHIRPLAIHAGETIDSLRPVSYLWKDPERGKGTKAGFVAQDVMKKYPQAILPAGRNLWGVDSNAINALLVLEVQDLRRRIAVLEKR